MKRAAFTMIETVIVLIIVVLIVSLTLPSMGQSERSLIEQRFWRELRQEWHQAQLRAEIHHVPTVIEYEPFTKEIFFSYRDGTNHVSIPATIQVVKFERVEMSPTGYSRARTQEFCSRLNGHTYLMKIQFAWGGYRLEEKK